MALIRVGITDTNRYRVNATKVYLRECNFILVAHANTIAGDDPGFRTKVLVCRSMKKSGNIAVMITQVDIRLYTIQFSSCSLTNKYTEDRGYQERQNPYLLDETGRLKSIDAHEKLVKAEQKHIKSSLATAKKNGSSGHVEELE